VPAALPPGWEGTGEDIRLALIHKGPDAPPSYNAWGTLTLLCRKAGVLELVEGAMRRPKGKKSHGRKIQVYRRARG
jgi:hypothetical protein